MRYRDVEPSVGLHVRHQLCGIHHRNRLIRCVCIRGFIFIRVWNTIIAHFATHEIACVILISDKASAVHNIINLAGVFRSNRYPRVLGIAHGCPEPHRIILHVPKRKTQIRHGTVRLVRAQTHAFALLSAIFYGLGVRRPRPIVRPAIPHRTVFRTNVFVDEAFLSRANHRSHTAHDVPRDFFIPLAHESPFGLVAESGLVADAGILGARIQPIIGPVRNGNPRRSAAFGTILVSADGLAPEAHGTNGLVGANFVPLLLSAEFYRFQIRLAIPPTLAIVIQGIEFVHNLFQQLKLKCLLLLFGRLQFPGRRRHTANNVGCHIRVLVSVHAPFRHIGMLIGILDACILARQLYPIIFGIGNRNPRLFIVIVPVSPQRLAVRTQRTDGLVRTKPKIIPQFSTELICFEVRLALPSLGAIELLWLVPPKGRLVKHIGIGGHATNNVGSHIGVLVSLHAPNGRIGMLVRILDAGILTRQLYPIILGIVNGNPRFLLGIFAVSPQRLAVRPQGADGLVWTEAVVALAQHGAEFDSIVVGLALPAFFAIEFFGLVLFEGGLIELRFFLRGDVFGVVVIFLLFRQASFLVWQGFGIATTCCARNDRFRNRRLFLDHNRQLTAFRSSTTLIAIGGKAHKRRNHNDKHDCPRCCNLIPLRVEHWVFVVPISPSFLGMSGAIVVSSSSIRNGMQVCIIMMTILIGGRAEISIVAPLTRDQSMMSVVIASVRNDAAILFDISVRPTAAAFAARDAPPIRSAPAPILTIRLSSQ
mmetsp:Transcript_5697/g.12455  ORF Transcript_5697/g.12455 Transcript_5697/m.12455 type:complete len:762 (+) Transcript_5697:2834-5119(+)